MSSGLLTCFTLLLCTWIWSEVTGGPRTPQSRFGAQRPLAYKKQPLLDQRARFVDKNISANVVVYEVVENTDVQERQILSGKIINKYYKPKKKQISEKRFTIFSRLEKKPRQRNWQSKASPKKKDIASSG